MSGETTPSSTTSLCPDCLERVPGTYHAREDGVYLHRDCPEHGTSDRKVWASLDHWRWASQFGPDPDQDPEPDDAQDQDVEDGDSTAACTPSGDCCGESQAGSLQVDGDHACLAVVEITEDCNLSCSYCFASSGPGGREKSVPEVVDLLETVKAAGGPRPIQFSGGEPTVHDRLPELVERAREMDFGHVEINTNGIALATREGYAERLADAGVTAIYLQFDGLESETYEAIREVDLVDVKHEAIEACRRAGLPVILVPTVVPGVNDHELGDIVRFALDNTDVVQSINVQPVAHFGRYATHDERFSLDAVAGRLADQIDALEVRDFLPVPCCSSYCQLSTAVVPDGDGGALPLTGLLDVDAYDELAGVIDEADWMELLAGTPAGAETAELASSCCGFELPGETSALPVTLTGFMDADAADAERLENCCISVPTADGDLVPFCAYNMTTEDGRYAIRNRNDWGGRDVVDPGDHGSTQTDGDHGSAQTDGGTSCCSDGPRSCCSEGGE